MKLKEALSWTIVSVIIRYAIKLVGNLTLARLLTPEDFGLSAIVLAVVTGIEAITDVGTRPALIRTHRNDDDWLDTAWTLGAVRGIAIAIAIAIAAYPLAHFFEDARLAPMIVATASMSILIGVTSITAITVVRDLQLKHYAILEIVAGVGGYIVMLSWAWFAPSAWALLSGAIISTGIFTVASHFMFGSRPIRLRWNRAVLRELTGFGKWVFLSSLAGFFILQGDRFGVAKLVSVSAAGLYTIAATWAMSLQTVFGMFLSRLYLPVASQLWRRLGPDNPRFLSLRRSVLVMMIVPYAFAAGFSDTIIQYLYPQLYFGAGPIMAILVVGGWFSTLEFLYNDQLMVSGEPRWRFYAQLLSVAAMGVGLVAVGRGFDATIIAFIFSGGAVIRSMVLMLVCDRRHMRQMMPDLALTAIFLLVTVAARGGAAELMAHVSPLVALVTGVIVAAPPASYLAYKGLRGIFALTGGDAEPAAQTAPAVQGFV